MRGAFATPAASFRAETRTSCSQIFSQSEERCGGGGGGGGGGGVRPRQIPTRKGAVTTHMGTTPRSHDRRARAVPPWCRSGGAARAATLDRSPGPGARRPRRPPPRQALPTKAPRRGRWRRWPLRCEGRRATSRTARFGCCCCVVPAATPTCDQKRTATCRSVGLWEACVRGKIRKFG